MSGKKLGILDTNASFLFVDADWLDAEKRDQDAPKRPAFPSIEELRDELDRHIDAKVLTL